MTVEFWMSAIAFKQARSAKPKKRPSAVDLSLIVGRNSRVDQRQAAREHGFVYFLRCEAFVKIGYSATPADRASKLQGSVPFDVELLGFIYGGTDLERALHAYMKPHHHRGEWYHATAAVLADVERMLGR